MGETGKSRVQPAFDGGDLVFADDDFLVGGGGHMDAHLAEEIGGEFLNSSCTDDELAVYTHETLWIKLALYFFKGHVQGMVLACEGA